MITAQGSSLARLLPAQGSSLAPTSQPMLVPRRTKAASHKPMPPGSCLDKVQTAAFRPAPQPPSRRVLRNGEEQISYA